VECATGGILGVCRHVLTREVPTDGVVSACRLQVAGGGSCRRRPDLTRESVRFVMQELIDAEATEQIGAGLYQRTDSRMTERNGSRRRQAGGCELKVPKPRQGSSFPVPWDGGDGSTRRTVGTIEAHCGYGALSCGRKVRSRWRARSRRCRPISGMSARCARTSRLPVGVATPRARPSRSPSHSRRSASVRVTPAACELTSRSPVEGATARDRLIP
jgi:hypothetical protein